MDKGQKPSSTKNSGKINQGTISHQNQMLGNNHSMVIRNSNSLGTISHQNRTKVNQPQGKSILSSFRNGPIKILNGTASGGHIGVSTYNRNPTASTGVRIPGQTSSTNPTASTPQGSSMPVTGGSANRPGSAPTHHSNLRPPSPAIGQAGYQPPQNRVKYNKSK